MIKYQNQPNWSNTNCWSILIWVCFFFVSVKNIADQLFLLILKFWHLWKLSLNEVVIVDFFDQVPYFIDLLNLVVRQPFDRSPFNHLSCCWYHKFKVDQLEVFLVWKTLSDHFRNFSNIDMIEFFADRVNDKLKQSIFRRILFVLLLYKKRNFLGTWFNRL